MVKAKIDVPNNAPIDLWESLVLNDFPAERLRKYRYQNQDAKFNIITDQALIPFFPSLDVATLLQKTGFDEKKIRNVIYKAFREAIIKRAGRGIYLGA
jgi:hypothetical protein